MSGIWQRALAVLQNSEEAHAIVEQIPVLNRLVRGDEDADAGDLVEDAVAALPSLCYRLLFYPPGTRLRLAPPQLGRLFLSPRKLSPPQDARDCMLRLAANFWRFRAEYRWATTAATVAFGLYDLAVWPLPWLLAELGCRLATRAPPAVAFPEEAASRLRAAKRAPRAKLPGRRVVVKDVGAGTVRAAADVSGKRSSKTLIFVRDRGGVAPFDPRAADFVFLSLADAAWQGRYVAAAVAASARLAPPTASRARTVACFMLACHAAARAVPRAYRAWLDDVLDKSEDPQDALRAIRDGIDFYVVSASDTQDYESEGTLSD